MAIIPAWKTPGAHEPIVLVMSHKTISDNKLIPVK